MQDISIIGIIVAVVVLVILLFMAIGYVKAPPDMAYIISGVKKKSKVFLMSRIIAKNAKRLWSIQASNWQRGPDVQAKEWFWSR